MSIPSSALIITAAGTSKRFKAPVNSNTKKEFFALNGHSVLYLSTKPFFKVPNLKMVIITIQPDQMAMAEYALEDLHLQNNIPITIVPGGNTRQESVYNALKELEKINTIDYVMIHDGSRPYVKIENILATFATANIAGASAPCIELSDSIKKVDKNGLILEHTDRNNYRAIQTPQIFKFDKILEAHKKASQAKLNDFSDDTAIYEKYIGKIILTKGDYGNKKITYPEDIK